MESKEKNARTIDRVRGVFLLSGMLISMSMMLLAFEWGQATQPQLAIGDITSFAPIPEDDIVNTKQEHTIPEMPRQHHRLIIIDTDTDLPPLDLINPEINHLDLVGTWIPPKDDEKGDDDDTFIGGFLPIQDQPSFKGGPEALNAFLVRNLKYPEMAHRNRITGKVYIGFTIEKDGRITEVKILGDIGAGCGAEAARVISMMPAWNPGKQRERPVRVKMMMPVDFQLEGP